MPTLAAAPFAAPPCARVLRVLSNLPTLDAYPVPGISLRHTCIGEHAGVWAAFSLFFRSFRHDVILLDGNEPCLWLLCLLRWLCPSRAAGSSASISCSSSRPLSGNAYRAG